MSRIVDLHQYRRKALQRRAYGPWSARFGRRFALSTRLADLSPRTLYRLAAPGPDGTHAFYELIMGVLDLGPAAAFEDLCGPDKMRVVDIHLFLADHVRFEMMRRGGWIDTLPAGRYPLVQMIEDFEPIREECRRHPPPLARKHPDYERYRRLPPRDREVFVRRLLSQALTVLAAGRPTEPPH